MFIIIMIIAGFVMRFMEDDLVVTASVQRASKPVHLKRLFPTESSLLQKTRSAPGRRRVTDQIVVKFYCPSGVKSESSLSCWFRYGIPSRMVFRYQHYGGPDHAQRAAPLSQQLLPE